MKINNFIKSSKVAAILNAGYKSSQNVILYGAGGYGKSEMSLAFLRQIGARESQICVKSLSVGSSVDDLFGGINIKTLQDCGRIEYNLDSSIWSYPFLILEEAFDAPLRVLEALKDTLTSGYVRNGAQSYKIATKFIIVCTNRSKADLIEDESSKALMERFPLSLRVEWETHTWADYAELINCVFGEIPEMAEVLLKYMLESIKEDSSKKPPPPRTVVRMVKVMNLAGIEALQFMDGLPNIDRALNSHEELHKAQQQEIKYKKELKALVDQKRSMNGATTIEDWKEFSTKVQNTLQSFTSGFDKDRIKEDIKTLTTW